MTRPALDLLRSCSHGQTYIRSHDRRWELFHELLTAGLIRIGECEVVARQVVVTDLGSELLA